MPRCAPARVRAARGRRASPPAWSLVLLALAGRYGYHRDELYFRQLSGSLSWGYVDQPPLTPLVARGAVALLGDSVWALRVPAARVGRGARAAAGPAGPRARRPAHRAGGRGDRRGRGHAAHQRAPAAHRVDRTGRCGCSRPGWSPGRCCAAEPRAWLLAGRGGRARRCTTSTSSCCCCSASRSGCSSSGRARCSPAGGRGWPRRPRAWSGRPTSSTRWRTACRSWRWPAPSPGRRPAGCSCPASCSRSARPPRVLWGAGLVALWRSPRLRPVRALGAAYLAGRRAAAARGRAVLLHDRASCSCCSRSAPSWPSGGSRTAEGDARRLRTVRLRRLLVVNARDLRARGAAPAAGVGARRLPGPAAQPRRRATRSAGPATWSRSPRSPTPCRPPSGTARSSWPRTTARPARSTGTGPRSACRRWSAGTTRCTAWPARPRARRPRSSWSRGTGRVT